jgi:cytochrome c oxidase subunit I
VRRSLFTTNHKVVGLQYFWLSLIAALIGVTLSVLMRMHLVNPGAKLPFLEGGVMTPELYLSLMTMHGTLMVFFVLSVAPQNAFGHYILPMQIGAERMAFPLLGSLSFWLTAASLLILMAAFFVPGGAPLSGWTAYPSALSGRSPDPGKEAGRRFGSSVWPCSAWHRRSAPLIS